MPTKVEERRAGVIERIIDTAWARARVDGIASLSLRRVASDVGMKAPSLYVYFDSKDAMLDAMFRSAASSYRDSARRAIAGLSPAAALKGALEHFLRFAVDDPERYQLLFQRPVPSFTPTEESFAVALESYADFVGVLGAAVDAGLLDPAVLEPDALDLITAISSGLAAQQLANEPDASFEDGRWTRLTDQVIEIITERFGRTT